MTKSISRPLSWFFFLFIMSMNWADNRDWELSGLKKSQTANRQHSLWIVKNMNITFMSDFRSILVNSWTFPFNGFPRNPSEWLPAFSDIEIGSLLRKNNRMNNNWRVDAQHEDIRFQSSAWSSLKKWPKYETFSIFVNNRNVVEWKARVMQSMTHLKCSTLWWSINITSNQVTIFAKSIWTSCTCTEQRSISICDWFWKILVIF